MDETSPAKPDIRIFTTSPTKEQYSELTSDLAPVKIDAKHEKDKGATADTQQADKGYWMAKLNSHEAPPILAQPYHPLVTAGQMHSLYAGGFPASGNSPARGAGYANEQFVARTAQKLPATLTNWGNAMTQQSFSGNQRNKTTATTPVTTDPPPSSSSAFHVLDSSMQPIHLHEVEVSHDYTTHQAAVAAALAAKQAGRKSIRGEYIKYARKPGHGPSHHQDMPKLPTQLKWRPDPRPETRPPIPTTGPLVGTFPPTPPRNLPDRSNPIARADTSSPVTDSSSTVTPSPPPRLKYIWCKPKGATLLSQDPLMGKYFAEMPDTGSDDGASSNSPSPPPDAGSSAALSIDDGTSPMSPFSNYPGGVRAWLSFVLQNAGQADNTISTTSAQPQQKPKMFTILKSEKIRRILATPDVYDRAHSFLRVLTGARIPRTHEFWATPKGKEILTAVERSDELVKMREVVFEEGEVLTVVEF